MQKASEGVEGEGRVQQQVDGRNNDILIQEATGRSAPGGEARVSDDRYCYKNGCVYQNPECHAQDPGVRRRA